MYKRQDLPFDKEAVWEEILTDPQAWAENILCHVGGYPEREDMGTDRILVRTPVKFREAGLCEYRKGPKIGEHTEEVLKELGYSRNEIDCMEAEQAVKAYAGPDI